MPMILVTKTTWKRKTASGSGPGVIRVVTLDGRYATRGGGVIPSLTLRFSGRTGHRLLAPLERCEAGHSDWKAARAALYHALDRDWVIEVETVVQAESEAALAKALGCAKMRCLAPGDYEFLASWFPVVVKKSVFRTHDGMQTIRVLEVTNADGIAAAITARKRAGHPEEFDLDWCDEQASVYSWQRRQATTHTRFDLVKLNDGSRTSCADEVEFRAHLGPALLGRLSRNDYARLVRNGDNSDATSCDVWDDGYDHGGTGLSRSPRAASASAPGPQPAASPPSAETPTGTPRLVPINAPSVARDADDAAYCDDPSFGRF